MITFLIPVKQNPLSYRNTIIIQNKKIAMTILISFDYFVTKDYNKCEVI